MNLQSPRPAYDLDNWSLRQDPCILLNTVYVVLPGRGAY